MDWIRLEQDGVRIAQMLKAVEHEREVEAMSGTENLPEIHQEKGLRKEFVDEL